MSDEIPEFAMDALSSIKAKRLAPKNNTNEFADHKHHGKKISLHLRSNASLLNNTSLFDSTPLFETLETTFADINDSEDEFLDDDEVDDDDYEYETDEDWESDEENNKNDDNNNNEEDDDIIIEGTPTPQIPKPINVPIAIPVVSSSDSEEQQQLIEPEKEDSVCSKRSKHSISISNSSILRNTHIIRKNSINNEISSHKGSKSRKEKIR
eukprot:963412_1